MNHHELQHTVHTTIPVSKHMGFTILSLSDQQIQVSAPLPQNINIHGTAFAGSIYTIATLTAWSLVYAILRDSGSGADLVLGEAQIKYKAPITAELSCQARISTPKRTLFLQQLKQSGRSRIPIPVSVNINGAAAWEGKFIAIQH